MQLVMTTLAVIAGLVFSIAISLLVEEFIFGEVFRLFFAQQAVEGFGHLTQRANAREAGNAVPEILAHDTRHWDDPGSSSHPEPRSLP